MASLKWYSKNRILLLHKMMNSERFQLWTALTCLSLINLISHNAELADENREREGRWVLSFSALSMTMGFLACLSHLIWKDDFSGSKTEGVFILIVFGLWCAALPALLDPDNEFAVKYADSKRNPLVVVTRDRVKNWKIPPRELVIFNANIFFSSWAAFIVALFLGIRHWQQDFDTYYHSMLTHWTCLFTASFVVMMSASRIWMAEDCVGDSDDNFEDLHFEKFCNRTLFAVILGVLSGVAGVVICFLRLKIVDQIGSMLSLVAWCCAAVYITYSYDVGPYENSAGPGKEPGTLYFGTWTCLIISLKMASKLLIESTIPEGAKVAPQVPTKQGGGPEVKDHHDFKEVPEDELVEEVETDTDAHLVVHDALKVEGVHAL